MIHQSQPFSGCFPTAIAMLYDVSVDEVVKVGLEGTSWTKWDKEFNTRRPISTYAEVVTRILNRFPGPRTLAFNNVLPTYSPPYPDELPNGKGAMTIQASFSGHVVAYNDQVIFDSNLTMGIPFKLWRDSRIDSGWCFVRIITMDEMKAERFKPTQLSLNLQPR